MEKTRNYSNPQPADQKSGIQPLGPEKHAQLSPNQMATFYTSEVMLIKTKMFYVVFPQYIMIT